MPDSAPARPPSGLILLCLDLQPAFLNAIPEHAVVQRRCAFAIQAAVGLGLEVVFTEQVPHKLGGTVAELVRFVPAPKVYAKTTFSAMANPAFRESLAGSHTEHILLCGIETSICVYQTALAALSAGMQVTLLSDCVGARRTDDARVCLDALVKAGVHLLPAETVFYSLVHDVAHPFFKTYTQLVKTYA